MITIDHDESEENALIGEVVELLDEGIGLEDPRLQHSATIVDGNPCLV